MSQRKEQSKFQQDIQAANETRFATLGRAIADAPDKAHASLFAQAVMLRRLDYANADRATQFAALVRQIGDAAMVGRDTAPLVQRLRELRRREVHGGEPAHI